jgi:hypothetical protein
MQLSTKPLLGFLLDPLFRRPRSIELKDEVLKVIGRDETLIRLDQMTSARIVVSKGPITTLVLATGPESHVRLSAQGDKVRTLAACGL